MDLCNDCTKKSLCSELCPEAEAYINQDVVNQKELTIGLPTYKNLPTDLHYKTKRKLLNNFNSKPKKEQVEILYDSGMSRHEMCGILGMSRKQVTDWVYRIKKERSEDGIKGEATQEEV